MTAPEARRRGRTPIRGWDGLKRFREGRVAVPGRKPAVLEVFLASAGPAAVWGVRLRVRRLILVSRGGYRHRSHAAKAARDLAGELGLDPWEDVEVKP